MFVYFSTKVKFEQATQGNEYDFTSIVFIGDTKELWNRGIFYATPNDFDIADYLTIADAAGTYQPKGDYLTEHQSLSEYIKTSEVNTKLQDYYNTTQVDSFLNGVDEKFTYYTTTSDMNILLNKKADSTDVTTLETDLKQWVEDKNYLQTHQSLSDYAKTSDVKGLISTAKSEILGGAGEDYDTLKEIETWIVSHQDLYDGLIASNATKGFVESKIDELSDVYQPKGDYLTEHQSLSNYYDKTQVDGLITGVRNDIPSLNGYATESWVSGKNYLVEANLTPYAKSNDVTNEIKTAVNGLSNTYYSKEEVDEMFEWGEY